MGRGAGEWEGRSEIVPDPSTIMVLTAHCRACLPRRYRHAARESLSKIKVVRSAQIICIAI